MKSAAKGMLVAIGTLALTAGPAYAQGEEPAGGAALGEIAIATTARHAAHRGPAAPGLRAPQRAHRGPVSRGRVRATASPAFRAGPRCPPPSRACRCSRPCSACTGTSRCTSTWGATRARWPTPPTTSSSPGCSASSPRASSPWCCPRAAPAAPPSGSRPAGRPRSGGVLICACGAFALLGFPLDDLWHRLFGQDVTLWGPTHLMLIGGAVDDARRASPCCWSRACAPTARAARRAARSVG